jgi:hypothetical protein
VLGGLSGLPESSQPPWLSRRISATRVGCSRAAKYPASGSEIDRVAVGAIQAASPLGFWWLDPATVYAVGLAAIAFVYIGFAVADGRWRVIALECSVAIAFVVIAAAGITGPAWLLVLGFAAHGLKDAWQQRAQFVSGTRWWPPFCAAVDWMVALAIAIEIVAGIHFQP